MKSSALTPLLAFVSGLCGLCCFWWHFLSDFHQNAMPSFIIFPTLKTIYLTKSYCVCLNCSRVATYVFWCAFTWHNTFFKISCSLHAKTVLRSTDIPDAGLLAPCRRWQKFRGVKSHSSFLLLYHNLLYIFSLIMRRRRYFLYNCLYVWDSSCVYVCFIKSMQRLSGLKA